MNIQIQKEEIEGAATEEAVRERLASAVRADRRRARLDRDRARALNAGQTAPALTKDQKKRLSEAGEIEDRALAVLEKVRAETSVLDRKAARGRVGQAYTMRRQIEAEREADLTATQDELRLTEAATLDALREGGEPASLIERKRGQKGVRIRSRDGLKSLHESGALRPRNDKGEPRDDDAALIEADRLLAIGLRYRDWYEMAQASMKSCLDVKDRVAVKRDFVREAMAAQRRAALNRRVVRCDGMVSMALGVDGLTALRMVAGESRTVNSISTGSRHRERLTAALALALGMIAGQVEKDH